MSESLRSDSRTKQIRTAVAVAGPSIRRGAVELALLVILYVVYSASRLLASNDFQTARGRGVDILNFEKTWRIAFEKPLNTLFANHDWLGLFGSYWYATTHYIVTAVILFWLYRRSREHYVTARRALVLATVIGLAFYLLIPTAPPRLLDGSYIDVLSQHAQSGWWGADASAPRGLGHMTNELAAMPSLHAGWAFWCGLVLIHTGVPKVWQYIGMAYAVVTTIVIIGTANHWVLDAVAGWLVIGFAWLAVVAWEKRGPTTERISADPVIAEEING